MSKNKKQHYVPACYLKAWKDIKCPPNQEPYVWVFDKDGTNARRKAPSNIFTETDLYTIHKFDGTRDLSIEKGLSELESNFTKIRTSKFNFHRPLDPHEHAYLCIFVAAAQFRTTKSRDHFVKQWGNISSKVEEVKNSKGPYTLDANKIYGSGKSFKQDEGALTFDQLKVLAEMPIQMMMPVVLETVTPILMKMKMAILCTDDPVGFITSDNPCVWYDPESYKLPPFYRSPGLGKKTIEITMPISPKQCLLFSWQDMEGYLKIETEVVDTLNHRHRMLSKTHYIVNTNPITVNEMWFKSPPMPDDS